MIKTQGRLPFRGCRVKKTADQSAADFTAGANVSWDAEDFDTDGFHSTVTNNSRITIPAELAGSYVEVGGLLFALSLGATNLPTLHIRKNGATIGAFIEHNSGANWAAGVSSGPLLVASADYFELLYQVSGDASSDIMAARSAFWLRVL